MKHLYRLADVIPEAPTLMNTLLQRQETFTATAMDGVQELVVREVSTDEQWRLHEDRHGAKEFPLLKRLALAVMAKTEASMLGRVIVLRIDSKKTVPVDNVDAALSMYAVVLHAMPGAMLMAGDESTMIRTGETWWFNSGAQLVNKSEDEVVIMFVEVRIDL